MSNRREAARRPLYKRLKPGPSNSSVEVKASQRARLRAAMVELVAERGYRGVTVRELSRTAGVSTGTFYSHFENVEECFFATCAWFLRDASRRMLEVPADRRAAVQIRTQALLRIFAESHEAAELALIEARSVCAANEGTKGPTQGLDRRLLRDVTASLRSPGIPVGASEAIAAGAMSIARSRLLAGDSGGLYRVADEVGLWALALCEGDSGVLGNGAVSLVGNAAPGAVSPVQEVGGERDRILSATVRVAMRRGYAGLTIPKIRSEAGVSRRRFNELFASADESFLAAVEDRFAAAFARSRRVASEAGNWRSGLVQMAIALCREIALDPALAHLAFVEVFAVGRRGVELVDRLILGFAECFRKAVPGARRPSEVFAQASAGAAWGMVAGQVKAGRRRQLVDLSPMLAFLLLAPILGRNSAARASAP